MTQSQYFISQLVEFINTADLSLAQTLVAPDARFFVPGQPDMMGLMMQIGAIPQP
jgi:hypothetical protein